MRGVPSIFLENCFFMKECIQLAACSEDELLPMDPDLPADLFTSCLTTPIQISVLWYIVKNDLKVSPCFLLISYLLWVSFFCFDVLKPKCVNCDILLRRLDSCLMFFSPYRFIDLCSMLILRGREKC